MSRLKARAQRKANLAKKQNQSGHWPELCRRIEAGQVIPIISGSIFMDQLFDIDGDGVLGIGPGDSNSANWNIQEQLSDAYATEINFPMNDPHRLALVVLFDRVFNGPDDSAAKTRYLNWLKDALLFLAEDDAALDAELIEELRDEYKRQNLSQIAAELGYPKQSSGQQNTFELLAKLKLPIYITTSPFDFLERAIMNDNTTPRTQVCYWSEEPVNYKDPQHETDYSFDPTPENPVVYHLFGIEDYPSSLVLTEDDYLDFLAAISRDAGQERPILPLYIRRALTQSSLILLGYRLRDWDFRVMFRGLINSIPSSLRRFNLAIQLDPVDQDRAVSSEQVRDYLNNYFGSSNFTVEWSTTEGFVQRLWQEWQQWRS
ncbi:MAG: SIR2 family protein [Candidatus Promineifilaceae bacterium]|nr:SIR2 family protein [Candidatus Promineifilaceae bacterium]